MQLDNLSISNFRTIPLRTIIPHKFNILVGPNGSGKSSTLEAISFLLTGKCGANPVKTGEKQGLVTGDVMGVPIERKCGAKSGVRMNGKTTTHKSYMEWIETTTGVTADTLRVATSSGMLAAMSSSELGKYLISNNLIPAEIDMETVKMLCTISKEAEDVLTAYLPPAPMKFDMDDVQEAYSSLFAARPVIKKQIAEKKAQAEYSGMEPTCTLAEIDKKLAAFGTYAAEIASYNKLMASYLDIKKKRENVQMQLATIEAEIKKRGALRPVDHNELSFLQKKENDAIQAMMKANQAIQTIDANLKMFRRTLENLDKPLCPISNKLVCTTDKTAIKDELTELVKENETLRQSAEMDLKKAQENKASIAAKIKDFQERDRAYQEFQSLHARRTAMLAGIPDLPEKPTPPEKIENAEEQVKELQAMRECIFMKQTADKAAKELPKLEAQLAVYEELISLLKPQGGIREKIVEAAFEPLIDHCNERAKELRAGLKIDLISDDGIRIVYSPNGSADMLPIEAASSGEQALIMLLILDAINALSGLGLMMLDDLDKLDETALDALFTLLSNPVISGSYDHIFIAMVNHEDSLRVLDKHKAVFTNVIAL